MGVRENWRPVKYRYYIALNTFVKLDGHYFDDYNWFEDYILYPNYLNYLNTEHFFGKRNHIIT